MHSLPVQVEAQPDRVPGAQRETRRALRRVGEPHDRIQGDRAMLGGEVPQHPTGGDREVAAS